MFVCVLLCWLHRCAYMLTASLHVCYRHLVSVWPDYILSVLLCTLPMPMPCLLPRAAHPARCTPSRYVCFPVLCSCSLFPVRCIFCVPAFSVRSIYLCMLFISICCVHLCVPMRRALLCSCTLPVLWSLRSVYDLFPVWCASCVPTLSTRCAYPAFSVLIVLLII